MEAAGDCVLDTAGNGPPGLQLTAHADGLDYEFIGLPSENSPGVPFDSFDVMVSDGERGWGYRPTDWGQVTVFLQNRLQGITRLEGLPLLEEPTGAAVPEALYGEIDWRCATEQPL